MNERWDSNRALELAHECGLGSVFAVVRRESLPAVKEVLKTLWAQGCRTEYLSGSVNAYLHERPGLWQEHDAAVLHLLEAPHRVHEVGPLFVMDETAKKLHPFIQPYTVPLVIVTDKSHTDSGEISKPYLKGPQEITDAVLSRGGLVLRTTASKIGEDLHRALWGILNKDYPSNLLIP